MPIPQELLARIRKQVFDQFAEHGRPPLAEELMLDFSLSRPDVTRALGDLEAARHIALVKGTDRILMAFPYSAIATPFRTTVGGRSYHANCAWDAVAFHAMLGVETRVDSFCHHCATPIRIDMRDGHAISVEPEGTLVYLALPPTRWWDDIITTCSNTMVFFASAEHRDASDLCASAASSASLTPDQTHALSGPIYSTKFALDYARPSKDQLLAHFAALGLTGDYWKL